MLLIYIYSDNLLKIKEYSIIIQNHIMINEFNCKLQLVSTDPADIVHFLEKEAIKIFSKNILVFIDIDLKNKVTGIELGKWIRNTFPLAQIVFIATHMEYLWRIIENKIEPLDYIIKNDFKSNVKSKIEEDLRYAYNYYLKCLDLKRESFKFKLGHEVKIIPLNDILSIETSTINPHKVILSTLNETSEFSNSIKHIHKHYTKLLKINRGILVNPENIIQFDIKKRLITLSNLSQYEVSFRHIKDVKKQLK